MKRSFPLVPVALVSVFSVVGCQDPLKDPQSIEEPRVLGVRMATGSDQSSLEPGASATFEVLLAGREGPLAARLAYTLCEAAVSDRGIPACEGAALADGLVELSGAPIAVDIPDFTPEGRRLVLLGTACLEGLPELGEDPLFWSCSDGGPALGWSFDAWTRSAEFVNQNPGLSELSVTIDGADIVLGALEVPASCDAGVPEVTAGATHRIEISLGTAAREAGETLQVSHFSTGGLLERQFTFIEPEQEPLTSLAWDAPRAGVPVKQYVVVRDGRGGVSFASFSLCAR